VLPCEEVLVWVESVRALRWIWLPPDWSPYPILPP
jgi:hypothetical protein